MSTPAIRPCPHCGQPVEHWRNPAPTVDIIIELSLPEYAGQIVLIERNLEPYGWALPGGFVDYGEPAEVAAVREAREEVSLDVELLGLVGVYSDPRRDARRHTMSVVYAARAHALPRAADDARNAQLFPLTELPAPLCFDHAEILRDYRLLRERGAFLPLFPGA